MTQSEEPREPESLSAALVQLAHPDPRARVLAAKALARQGASVSQAVPQLLRTLGDPDPMVRSMAASALGRIGCAAAVDGLLAALDDPLVPVRFWAADALGRLKPDRADVRQALEHLASSAQAHVRVAAQRALAALPRTAGGDGRSA